jgi:hypothetical protein
VLEKNDLSRGDAPTTELLLRRSLLLVDVVDADDDDAVTPSVR